MSVGLRRGMLDGGLLDDPGKPPKTSWKIFIQSHLENLAARGLNH